MEKAGAEQQELKLHFSSSKTKVKRSKVFRPLWKNGDSMLVFFVLCVCTCCVCMYERDQCAWCLGSGFSGVGDKEEKII